MCHFSLQTLNYRNLIPFQVINEIKFQNLNNFDSIKKLKPVLTKISFVTQSSKILNLQD